MNVDVLHPHVDIVCLVHNQLVVTKGFVKRLFENTTNFRLIFVDNGSDDETSAYLRSDPKWKYVRSDVNLGVIKGRNLGAEHVESEYFLNIDNDQYPNKGWLDGLFDLHKRGYDIVGPEAWALSPPNSTRNIVVNNTVVNQGYFPYKHCKNPNDAFTYIGCGGMLIPKYVYDKIGLFDERFSPAYFEDPDFSFRCLQNGFRLGWKHNCPIDHLEHKTINTQKLFNKNSQFSNSFRKFREKWHPYFPEPIVMPKCDEHKNSNMR